MSAQNGAYKVALADKDAAGGVLSLANPEGADVIVTNFILNVTTASTGACTIDAGVAANGTTSKDTLIDGQDVNAAVGVFASTAKRLWKASEYITVSKATGAAAGLKGYAYIEYIRA